MLAEHVNNRKLYQEDNYRKWKNLSQKCPSRWYEENRKTKCLMRRERKGQLGYCDIEKCFALHIARSLFYL